MVQDTVHSNHTQSEGVEGASWRGSHTSSEGERISNMAFQQASAYHLLSPTPSSLPSPELSP